MSLPARDNPYRTEQLDALVFDPGDRSLEGILCRLKDLNYRAAIVGPHGTGKSTCLKFIARSLGAVGLEPVMRRVDGGYPMLRWGQIWGLAGELKSSQVMILDGADHLPWLKAWLLCLRTRRAGGLIVTSHAPWHLPTLITTAGDVDLLRRLIDRLTGRAMDAHQAEALLMSHGGNIREALFELYDRAAEGLNSR